MDFKKLVAENEALFENMKSPFTMKFDPAVDGNVYGCS